MMASGIIYCPVILIGEYVIIQERGIPFFFPTRIKCNPHQIHIIMYIYVHSGVATIISTIVTIVVEVLFANLAIRKRGSRVVCV